MYTFVPEEREDAGKGKWRKNAVHDGIINEWWLHKIERKLSIIQSLRMIRMLRKYDLSVGGGDASGSIGMEGGHWHSSIATRAGATSKTVRIVRNIYNDDNDDEESGLFACMLRHRRSRSQVRTVRA